MVLRVQGSWQSLRSLVKASPAARPTANNLERSPNHTVCVALQQKEDITGRRVVYHSATDDVPCRGPVSRAPTG